MMGLTLNVLISSTSELFLAIVDDVLIGAIYFAALDDGTFRADVWHGPMTNAYLGQFVNAAVDQIFALRNPNKLHADPASSDVVRMLEEAYFTEVGLQQKERLIGDVYVDTVLMERLNPSWNDFDNDEENEIEINLARQPEQPEEEEEDETEEETVIVPVKAVRARAVKPKAKTEPPKSKRPAPRPVQVPPPKNVQPSGFTRYATV